MPGMSATDVGAPECHGRLATRAQTLDSMDTHLLAGPHLGGCGLRGRGRGSSPRPATMSNSTQVHVSWVATTQLRTRPNGGALSRYFSVAPRTSLFRAHSIPNQLWAVPLGLSPRDGFHEVATYAVFGHRYRRTPYPTIELSPQVALEIVSLTVDLFPGDVISATVNGSVLTAPELDHKRLLKGLQLVRIPKQIPAVDALIKEAIALAQGDRNSARSGIGYRDYFLIDARLPLAPEALDRVLLLNESEMVALLIGATESELLRADLIGYVSESSAELNEKAVGEKLLLNRQGALYIHTAEKYRGPHPNRFSRTRDLARLALYARELLRDDEQFSARHRMLAQFIVSRIEQWIEHAELVFDASVSETRTWEAFVDQFLLKQRLAAWRHLFSASADQKSRAIGLSKPAWWTSEQLEALLEAEVPPDVSD